MLMSHNKEVYENLTAAMEENRSVCFIHGTGLGKSFIFFEVAGNLKKGDRILYVIPKWTIADQICAYPEYSFLKAEITFRTYNYFKKERDLTGYGLVVFDEVHHIASDKYGRNALASKTDGRVLGLTATNIRDDKIDVTRYFEATVSGLGTFDAIRQGLIPPFEYLVCSDDSEERVGYDRDAKDYRKEVVLDESLPLLSEVVADNPRNRWICFFRDIHSLNENESLVRSLFGPDYEYVKITTKHSGTMKDVTEHEKTVILCVDKLLEGVHVPDTQGIILFRNVRSLPVFQQILGRVVHVGAEIPPVVLDCTRTAIRMLAKLLAEDKKSRTSTPGGGAAKPILYCSLKNAERFNLTKLLALAQEQNANPWTEDEEKILKERFKGCPYKELIKLLPRHTRGSIQRKAKNLGLLENREHEWSEAELRILKANANECIIADMRELLPGKTDTAIKSKCKTLGYPLLKKHKDWTEEEMDVIRANAEKMTWKEMVALLPERTWQTIKAKANSLGYKHDGNRGWSDEQERYLKEHYFNTDIDALCQKLNKKKPAVRLKARQMGLYVGVKREDRLWDDGKVEYLKKNYLVMDRNELSVMLGIPPRCITSKAAELGLRKRA